MKFKAAEHQIMPSMQSTVVTINAIYRGDHMPSMPSMPSMQSTVVTINAIYRGDHHDLDITHISTWRIVSVKIVPHLSCAHDHRKVGALYLRKAGFMPESTHPIVS